MKVKQVKTVLHIHSNHEGEAHEWLFMADVKDEDDQPFISKKHPLVYISNEMFEEMGQPLDLVVTVEPEKEATR